MFAHRVIFSTIVIVGMACAATPAPDLDPEPDRPFLKLANREMALLTHWLAPAPSPAYRQQLQRNLSRHLKTRYRTEVPHYAREGKFRSLDPQLLMTLVEGGVDDLVVVEVHPKGDGALGARVRVVTLNDQAVRHDLELQAVRGKTRRQPSAERLADLITVRLTKVWTDPGAAPKMDPLATADQLADRKACRHALRIYERVLPTSKAQTVTGIQRMTRAQSRYAACKDQVAEQDAIEADRRARFEVRLEADAVSAQIREALQAALQESTLKATLREMTHKPVTITALPGNIVLEMRYHPGRYRAATLDEPKYDRGQPVVYLDPFIPAIAALIDLRERTMDHLPPYARSTFARLHTTLRLNKLPRSYLDIDFAELDGRVLFTDSLRVKLGANKEEIVASTVPGVSLSRKVVLGPPESAAGTLTSYGLVFRFLELQP